ncbi:type VI secretion system-associated FHA domain protein TagH [Undibacterium pigrum]|uniref:FHA domain protein n=1 Tax=Undibacterium pigrum TaxID=401470 RepID=A0A318JBC4_9BURK|nr:type VI secretion system-associated FHA domain protein TagH [Undibacterium pigrum]PXX45357.1 FHA domain protein [Undibacterium pigrum]
MIKIAVVSYNNEAPDTPVFAVFGPEPATIGRNVENFLALPDPKHFVSRTQAHVWSTGGQHFINNLSLANPVSINGKEIKAETAFEIHPGDEIQIGLYVLRAEAAEAAAASDAAQAVVETAASVPAVPESATDSIEVKAVEEDKPQPQAITPTAPTTSVAKEESTVQPPQFLLRPEAVSQPVEIVAGPISKPVPQAEVAANDGHANKAETAKAVGNANELIQAFLQGAGLQQLNLASGLTVELMETLGKFMAASVQGAMEELSQRALLKREVKAEVTMVVLRENNPLKFFPDSKTVLTQMLRKKMPGFMAPAEAMEDAFFDIRTHQMGVAAGNKAVTEAILKNLQPAHVEAQLGTPGLLDQINPARRKAAMWDQFSELFDTISSGKKDEFQALFGKEFLLAYEKEVEKAEQNR